MDALEKLNSFRLKSLCIAADLKEGYYNPGNEKKVRELKQDIFSAFICLQPDELDKENTPYYKAASKIIELFSLPDNSDNQHEIISILKEGFKQK